MKFSPAASSSSASPSKNNGPRATLVGASIETYLLEKVRLVYQSPGERNYHIFYELFSLKYDEDSEDEYEEEEEEKELDDSNNNNSSPRESNSNLAERFGLLNYDMEDFRLINTSDTYDRRDGVSDVDTFHDMTRAMTVMGFTPTDQTSVFGVTAALLHASNLTVQPIGEVECALEMDNPHLEYVVDLLGITKEGLNNALCYYEIIVGRGGAKGGEKHVRVLSQGQVEKGVEALIKATYGAMFQYLVGRINDSVAGSGGGGGGGAGKESRVRRRGDSGIREASIGILVG